jgi:hypothetical protein
LTSDAVEPKPVSKSQRETRPEEAGVALQSSEDLDEVSLAASSFRLTLKQPPPARQAASRTIGRSGARTRPS